MKRVLLLALLVWSAGLSAGTLRIVEGYVREMPPGQSTSAAFMRLINDGATPIAIVAASSDSAGSAELHGNRHDNGMMQMVPVKRIEVPARGQAMLAPGGNHLMLINLKRSLRAGEQVGITLFDEQGKTYTATLPVVNILKGAAPAAAPAAGHGAHHH